jgi:hypothetical protein
MAHFAQINSNNIVERVIVVNNEDCKDKSGNESEAVGSAFCNSLLGGTWKQTSYNAKFRKNYAGPGFTYNEELDAFIPPKTYSKWVLNEETCQWEAPVPRPEGSSNYSWNDNEGEWEEVVLSA